MTDVLEMYRSEIRLDAIDEARKLRLAALERPFWAEVRELLSRLSARRVAAALDEPRVRVGSCADLREEEHALLRRAIEALIPWRKGPFELFGHTIDAEWRSDMKWDRIASHLGPLEGKRVADFGCGNGYYLFRLFGLAKKRGESPELVLGFDPSERFYFAFQLLRRFIAEERFEYELLGVEHAPLFPEFFDLVLCLGVVYHQRDPHEMLDGLYSSIRPGGRLILESQCIPGEDPEALIPKDRYAKARNVYFVPTPAALAAWAERAGFEGVRVVSVTPVTSAEQSRTELAPYESLGDFLDPADPSKTVEGYPAPLRAVVLAEKRAR